MSFLQPLRHADFSPRLFPKRKMGQWSGGSVQVAGGVFTSRQGSTAMSHRAYGASGYDEGWAFFRRPQLDHLSSAESRWSGCRYEGDRKFMDLNRDYLLQETLEVAAHSRWLSRRPAPNLSSLSTRTGRARVSISMRSTFWRTGRSGLRRYLRR